MRTTRVVGGLGGVLVTACLAASCGGQPQASPSTSAAPAGSQVDLSRFYFPISIDYANPSLHLLSGTQSTLTPENSAVVDSQIPVPSRDVAGVASIFAWMRRNFVVASAGGATVGKTDVNDLLRDHTLRGCHDWGLLLSTVLRHFGFPAVMVDAAGIDWAEKYRTGQVTSFVGHVFVEVYLDGRWIVMDSTAGTYAANYDYQEPVLPFTQSGDSRGHYVLYKGVDPAGYGVTSNEVLTARMREFAQALPGITLFFPVYDLRPLPNG